MAPKLLRERELIQLRSVLIKIESRKAARRVSKEQKYYNMEVCGLHIRRLHCSSVVGFTSVAHGGNVNASFFVEN